MNTNQQRTDKVIFLFGPTAVGKTDLLCSFFSCGHEVVNADSVQVYKNLNIGSAKADEEVKNKIKHYLVDILDPWESFNVAKFITLADEACLKIREHGNIPVLCGGTAFYFKSFMYGLSEAPSVNEKTRLEVASFISANGNEKAHEYLASIDPISAAKINVRDTYRISRAIEVYKDSGRMLSSFSVPKKIRANMDILILGLRRDKQDLKNRIEKRVNLMFEQGLVHEIEKLKALGANESWQSMQGIGYSEFFKYPQFSESELKEKIVMDSLHYAKRQMTFFNSFANVNWLNPDEILELERLVSTFEHN